MEKAIFIKGVIVGLAMCAPVGPIGLLCIRRTLLNGRMAGLVSLLGASTADGLYCAFAGLGITFISTFLHHEELKIRLIGGLILVIVGLKFFFSRPAETTPETRNGGLLTSFSSTFLLMLTNPMPIIIFSAAFTALGAQGWRGDYASTAVLVIGVFCGSALWAPILVSLVGFFHSPRHSGQMKLINRVSGVIMMALGIVLCLMTIAKIAV